MTNILILCVFMFLKDIMEKLMDCVEKDHYNNITLINSIRTEMEERDRVNDERWNMIHDAIVNDTYNGTINKIGEGRTWTSFSGYSDEDAAID